MADDLVNAYKSLPPVTRLLILSTAAVSIPPALLLVQPYLLVFSIPAIRRGQIWRLATPFFYSSASGLGLLFDVFMLYRNAAGIEAATRSPDFAYSLVIQALIILALNYPVRGVVFFRPLLAALTTQWAEANRGSSTSLFGLVTIPAPYLPYVLVLFDFINGGFLGMAHTLTGVIAAHVYIYLDQVYPRTHRGQRLLKTPALLERVFAHPNARNPPSARVPRVWGRGRRLGG